VIHCQGLVSETRIEVLEQCSAVAFVSVSQHRAQRSQPVAEIVRMTIVIDREGRALRIGAGQIIQGYVGKGAPTNLLGDGLIGFIHAHALKGRLPVIAQRTAPAQHATPPDSDEWRVHRHRHHDWQVL
jgi:hypothetical protein